MDFLLRDDGFPLLLEVNNAPELYTPEHATNDLVHMEILKEVFALVNVKSDLRSGQMDRFAAFLADFSLKEPFVVCENLGNSDDICLGR